MALGTTETISSLALAMIPPGNVIRTIADLRRALWSRFGIAGARAYFDYPLLAWLGSPIDESTLIEIAGGRSVPFVLSGLERIDDEFFLRFPADTADRIADIVDSLPIANRSSEYRPGPFVAGYGCYCGSVPGGRTFETERFDDVHIKAKTYLLAQVDLRWMPDASMASSWNTTSEARYGSRERRRL